MAGLVVSVSGAGRLGCCQALQEEAVVIEVESYLCVLLAVSIAASLKQKVRMK